MSSQVQKQVNNLCSSLDTIAFLTTKAKKAIYETAPSQTYPAGIELFQQGSPAQDVYFIDHGLVKLLRLEQDGSQMIVTLRLPGWLIADSSAISKRLHPVTAVTLNKCSLRRIPAQVFRHLLITNAEFSLYLHEMHSHEVLDQTTRMTQLGCLPARLRLEHLLWQLISALEPQRVRHEVKFELPLKQWEIAELIAVKAPYLSNLFNELEQDSILYRHKGWLIIPDPQKLWHCTD